MPVWIITDSNGKFIAVCHDLYTAKRSLYESLIKAGVTIIFTQPADIQTIATCSNGQVYTLQEYLPYGYPAPIV